MLYSMQSNFPRLVQMKISQFPKAFEGFIDVSGRDYYICIQTPNFPSAKGIIVKAEIQLEEILQNSDFNQIKFEDDSTILQYLKTLQSTCDSHLIKKTDYEDHLHCTQLISDIKDMGWHKVSGIAADFSFMDLEYRDERERKHTLHVQIPPKYPLQAMVAEADFPSEINFDTSSNKTLRSLFENWTTCILTLQPFWNALDDLDDTVLVIDPAKPLRKHATRRILLDNQVSLHLTVSSECPYAPPKCQLLGPSSIVTPLNDKLVELYKVWDEHESIVYNLERVLRHGVVPKGEEEPERALDEWDVECAICYCLRLQDQLPDTTCDQCKKSFHVACLYEWLRSLSSSRQSAQYIRGDCPHCTKAISCKVHV